MKKIFIMATAALLMAGMASCVDKSASTTETAEAATEEVTTDTEIKDNKTLGREFLEQNAKNDSVVQTESGLQYMVLKEGTAPSLVPPTRSLFITPAVCLTVRYSTAVLSAASPPRLGWIRLSQAGPRACSS